MQRLSKQQFKVRWKQPSKLKLVSLADRIQRGFDRTMSITGKDITPFVLDCLNEHTGGMSLRASKKHTANSKDLYSHPCNPII